MQTKSELASESSENIQTFAESIFSIFFFRQFFAQVHIL